MGFLRRKRERRRKGEPLTFAPDLDYQDLHCPHCGEGLIVAIRFESVEIGALAGIMHLLGQWKVFLIDAPGEKASTPEQAALKP